MSSYINFNAFGQTVLFSFVAVLAVTGSFAVGARAYATSAGSRAAARPAAGQLALAVVCFAIATAGVVIGVWFILDK